MSPAAPLLSHEGVGRAAQIACLLEVCAPKPGNVSPLADFEDARFEDFILSAVAIGPAIGSAHTCTVGDCILNAVRATRRLVATNTNLGTVLLLCPLAKAYGPGSLRERLRDVLASLTVEDARLAYEAIRLARPGGLGSVPLHDVYEQVTVTLREAMESARARDTIAREYVTDFEVTFGVALPALLNWRRQVPLRDAIVQMFLIVLAQVPDSLIARKNGPALAVRVSRAAGKVLAAGGVTTPEGKRWLRRLDTWLRSRGNRLNPGTTADLTAAGLFAAMLQEGFAFLGEKPAGHMQV